MRGVGSAGGALRINPPAVRRTPLRHGARPVQRRLHSALPPAERRAIRRGCRVIRGKTWAAPTPEPGR